MFMSSFLRLVAVNWSPLALRQSALFCYTEKWVTTLQSVRWIHMRLRYHMASSIDAQLHFAMKEEGIHIYIYLLWLNKFLNIYYIHKPTKCDLMKWWHDVIGHRTPSEFWRVIVDSAIMFLLWRFSSTLEDVPNPIFYSGLSSCNNGNGGLQWHADLIHMPKHRTMWWLSYVY